jgi:uncharacterized peroxidase-related enzyme
MVHHGEFLRAASKDDHLVYHVERDWQQAPLEPDERALCAYVQKLTLQPGRIVAEDVEALRTAGFDDRGILDIVLITAYFALMNRLLDGVGYRAEPGFRAAKERGDARVEAELAHAPAAAGD